MGKPIKSVSEVHGHFIERADSYEISSIWITDPVLLQTIREMAAPKPTDVVIDCACGTGMVGKSFVGHVKTVFGADMCRGMLAKAVPRLTGCLLTNAEALPFQDGTADIITCRAAIQFMMAPNAFKEFYRVLKPGGRLVISQYNPHQEFDQDLYYKILWTRQPFRNKCFNELDIRRLYRDAGITDVRTKVVYTYESTNAWLDNVNLTEEEKEEVRDLYRNASEDYKMLHEVKFVDGDIIDKMRNTVFSGTKPA